MLLELLRPVSFFLSMLSLYPVLVSAFFVPGTRWEERLWMALLRLAVAGCLCFASGLLYRQEEGGKLLATLPVRLFFCGAGGMMVLFCLSWWLDTYYIPLLQHGCCRP